jgi:hypothetical protein
MSSSISSLMGQISAFRNPTADAESVSYLRVVAAQCAYTLIVPYAIVETVISQVVRAISSCLNLNPAKYQKIQGWAESSAYSTLWAIHSIFVNLCFKKISATENDFKKDILNRKQPEPVTTTQLPNLPAVRIPVRPEPDRIDPIKPVNPKPTIVDLIPQPITPVPTSKDPAIAQLLGRYRLAENAKKYSDLMEKIYSDIPEPDDLQLYGLVTQLTVLLKKRGDDRIRDKILQSFEDIAVKIETKKRLNLWEERLLKMTVAIYGAIMKLEGDDLEAGQEILILGLLDAFQNCSNRQSAEIERLYFRYVAPELLAAVEAAATLVETLIFELMQFRIRMRDEIINRLCPDAHNAASHRYFRKKLNESTFFLPTSLLSAQDEHYGMYAMKANEDLIINEFNKIYDNPNTIYDIFIGLLYPNPKDTFRFKPAMFTKWLEENGLMNANAFSDEDMTIYKLEIMIRFLVENGFLIKKGIFENI